MVKNNQPLQIRLTEPVVFLRGPSTGLDFRGRPIGVDDNAPPAMLRGLLTLRLSKATRIRSVVVRLEGVSRTEWPEGIGPRRLDTFEEHSIISESTSFFDARRPSSRSQSRSTRRAASVGPGAYIRDTDHQPNEHSLDDDDDDEGPPEQAESRFERGRERGRGVPARSASALPGVHDGGTWHREGFSRRPSYTDSDRENTSAGEDQSQRGRGREMPAMREVRNVERERGPSPAYTPRATTPVHGSSGGSGTGEGSIGAGIGSGAGALSRSTILSPIQSAVPSRAPSDRDHSAEAPALRRPSGDGVSSLTADEIREGAEDADGEVESPGETPVESGGESGTDNDRREGGRLTNDEESHHAIRSILSAGPLAGPRRDTGGEVRFAPTIAPEVGTRQEQDGAVAEVDDDADGDGAGEVGVRRAEYPHSHAAILAISAVSTAHNSPAPSRPASLHPRSSLDTNHSSNEDSDLTSLSQIPGLSPNHRRSSILAPLPYQATTSSPRHSISGSGSTPPPAASTASSRPPSLHQPDSRFSSRPGSMHRSAASSTTSLTEVRQGRKNRLGSHSTIVINTDPNVPSEQVSSPLAMGSTSDSRPPSIHENGNSGHSHGPYGHSSSNFPGLGAGAEASSSSSTPASRYRAESNAGTLRPGSIDTSTGPGRKGRFSLAATLRGLSQDVKDRVRQSSKSRTRQPSIGGGSANARGRIGSITDVPVPPLPPAHRASLGSARERDESASRSRSTTRQLSGQFNPPNGDYGSGSTSTSRRAIRAGSFTATDPDFIPPGGSRGAARVNSSRERRAESSSGAGGRTDSPAPTDRRMSAVGGGSGGGRSESRGRGRNKGMKVLTDALGLGEGKVEEEEEEKGGEDVHNWKEFRKGTYNYPISFPIPVSTPPTVHAEFGSVTYRLKATVVRVGALTPNLTEEVEVTMIATPQEDDLEETENVIVERQWEEQMRYQIALSGKAFPIGGIIPLSVRIMPLMKCKIHRLSCVLEEKTDYFAQGRKVIRHETPRRFTLLFIKQSELRPSHEPLLPIISDITDAARQSPLAEMARAAALSNPSAFTNFAGEHDEDALYAGMMDPLGPWHLETELQVPDCALKVRFTTKHEKANMSVSHWLKVTIRVERGDDVALDTKGRRKQFDIIIETPIKLLDCRVNPQWNSLPTYSTASPSSTAALSGMCSIHGTKSTAASMSASGSRPAITQRISSSTNVNGMVNGVPPYVASSSRIEQDGATAQAQARRVDTGDDTLLERNIVYDRLMSGQESEMGDVPPSYGEALAVGPGPSSEGGERRRRSATPSSSGRVRGSSPHLGSSGVSPAGAGRVGRVRDDGEAGGSRSRSRLRQEV